MHDCFERLLSAHSSQTTNHPSRKENDKTRGLSSSMNLPSLLLFAMFVLNVVNATPETNPRDIVDESETPRMLRSCGRSGFGCSFQPCCAGLSCQWTGTRKVCAPGRNNGSNNSPYGGRRPPSPPKQGPKHRCEKVGKSCGKIKQCCSGMKCKRQRGKKICVRQRG